VADEEAKLEKIVAEDSGLTYQISTANETVTCATLDGFDAAPVAFGSDITSLTTFGKPLLLGRDPFTMLMEMMKRLGSNKHQTGCNYTAIWSDSCWRCRREA
jgi:hypothetical protein